MAGLYCDWALLPQGWTEKVRIGLSETGQIDAVEPNAEAQAGDRRLPGRLVIPAPCNLHSHAFQRAMAGHAEHKADGQDSFWTWRQAMYGFLTHLTPDDIEAIAAYAFMEMLETGYAAVGEFHYLHHDLGGRAYADPAETSHRIAAAAESAGIGLTLLPVLYSQGGADGRTLNGQQQRFGNVLEDYQTLHAAIRLDAQDSILGCAAHSLRAVPPDALSNLVQSHQTGPIHIHIAEQTAEVDEIEAAYGARPVAWLLDNQPIDARWCLVHATHMDPNETEALARSGAVAGICPMTEGNLGDGIFDGARYVAAGGRYGIGSDSHIRIGLTEELRLFEYSQRLKDRRRTILRDSPGSIGTALFDAVTAGGAQALGRNSGRIEVGAWADLTALDAAKITPFVPNADHWLDHWIFTSGDAAIRDVWSAGRPVVSNGRHHARDAIEAGFTRTLRRLMGR